MVPIYHRIHLGLGISPELPWQNDSIRKSLFSGPIFDPKKVPGPTCRPGYPKSNPGLKNPPPGMKNQKMRAEKPCRSPVSEFQTEPYSASYGQKPFWRVPAKILVYLRGQILFSKREILFATWLFYWGPFGAQSEEVGPFPWMHSNCNICRGPILR